MKKIVMLIAAASLTGCAATQVAISKRNLDVQTKMSATIFLEPVAESQRTIFVQVRNTSDKPDFDIAEDVKQSLSAKGYRLVTDPAKAHYILQANILQVGRSDQSAAEKTLNGGYGAITGFATGAIAAATISPSYRDALGAGLAIAAISTLADAAVKDVYYSAITDIQIQERIQGSGKANKTSLNVLKQGTSGGTAVTYAAKTNMLQYQTRILSSANKVNLEFPEAAPALRAGLVRSISGMF
ncbi:MULTISPECIES: complement resistance protein TraT [Gulbenkiania]|uniref:Enterobacterial TraT complement resistance protein n=2 Tax=Gulbenkiania TaxID=397456 RepID=A0A0K6H488_9NEIS|nr:MULTISPECIES: complement resistance protein TraT [Gulbenkiania]TCW30358.1 TraT complement resistance protein [Gulbenkiania mobilis]CUA85804.1 Enterobacterial TraT complement resistance protein [Gulbenkiania indica]